MEAGKVTDNFKIPNPSSRNENTDVKLEWMYKNANQLINREEYLLGRSIDKSFEVLQEEERRREQEALFGVKQPINHVEHECIPFSIRFYKNHQSTEQVDLQRKIMDDPLMIIKEREMETRRRILENPVKLKELQKAVKESSKLGNEKKVKKSKKRKKKKKRRVCSSSSSGSDSDIDNKLLKKMKKQFGSDDGALNSLLNSDYKTISKYLDNILKQLKKKQKQKTKLRKESDVDEIKSKTSDADKDVNRHMPHSESSNIEKTAKHDSPKHYRKNEHRDQHRLSRSRHSATHNKNRKRSCSRTSSPAKKHKHKRSRSRSKSTEGNGKQNTSKTGCNTNSKSNTEEKEARLREMMLNAEWREKERSSKVRKHRQERDEEEAKHREDTFDKQFLNKEVRKAIDSQTSIKSRLHANMNNIQRNSSAMATNFARK